jgi:putative PIG3 family NAD(P)H quinone oxidoreductase
MNNAQKCNAIISENNLLRLGQIDTPVPKDGEVLIKIHFAGVNRPDLLQLNGIYPPPKGASPILGLEVSGEIVAIGKGVKDFAIGDMVCALLSGGGYAEYATAYHGCCLPIPKGFTMEQAAALPETVFTVYTNIFDACGLKPNETLLIHGGASGIGTAAIQMAKAWGAKVFVTVGSEEKAHYCKSLGADLVINYKTQDFEEIVKENGGADVILDMVGGSYVQKNINIMNEFGRLCYIAFLQGEKVEVNLMRLMLKRLTITGSVLRSRTNHEKGLLAKKVHNDIWGMIEAGKYKVMIDEIFALKDAALALEKIAANQTMGKIVLRVV